MHRCRKTVCSCVLQASLFPPGDASSGGLQSPPLPNPNISFHLWTEDDQLCECPGGLWRVGMVPEAGKPVPNMSFSPDSWAVSFITLTQGPNLQRLVLTAPAFLLVGCRGQIRGLGGKRGEGDGRGDGPLWDMLQQDAPKVPDLRDTELSSWCRVKWD